MNFLSHAPNNNTTDGPISSSKVTLSGSRLIGSNFCEPPCNTHTHTNMLKTPVKQEEEEAYAPFGWLLKGLLHLYMMSVRLLSTHTVVYASLWLSKGKCKAVLLQAWSGPEGSRKLRFSDFMTTAQDGGKVLSLTHWPPLPPGSISGTHFC